MDKITEIFLFGKNVIKLFVLSMPVGKLETKSLSDAI